MVTYCGANDTFIRGDDAIFRIHWTWTRGYVRYARLHVKTTVTRKNESHFLRYINYLLYVFEKQKMNISVHSSISAHNLRILCQKYLRMDINDESSWTCIQTIEFLPLSLTRWSSPFATCSFNGHRWPSKTRKKHIIHSPIYHYLRFHLTKVYIYNHIIPSSVFDTNTFFFHFTFRYWKLFTNEIWILWLNPSSAGIGNTKRYFIWSNLPLAIRFVGWRIINDLRKENYNQHPFLVEMCIKNDDVNV